jgi:hypothetical protein
LSGCLVVQRGRRVVKSTLLSWVSGSAAWERESGGSWSWILVRVPHRSNLGLKTGDMPFFSTQPQESMIPATEKTSPLSSSLTLTRTSTFDPSFPSAYKSNPLPSPYHNYRVEIDPCRSVFLASVSGFPPRPNQIPHSLTQNRVFHCGTKGGSCGEC